MRKYYSNGFRPVVSDSIKEAAEMFANREAKNVYGKKGFCRIMNVNCHSEDYSTIECCAFIGYKSGRDSTTGHNFNFTVSTR